MLANSEFDLPQHDGAASRNTAFKDVVLWNSFRKGNELALSLLYKKYVHHLYDYGMHTCRNSELVKDCVQDLFMRLWNKRETLSAVENVKPYFYKAFRRLLFHQLAERRKLLARMAEEATAFEISLSVESSLIDDEVRAERNRALKACIQSLTKGQREVIYLKFFNELTYREIADIMEMQVDSVYNLISKAIGLLRKRLQKTGTVASR